MSNRDDLIAILHQEATADRVKNSPLRDVPVVAAKVESAADAILAAGFRRPRVVTTAEELDALPALSVVLDKHGESYQKLMTDEGASSLLWMAGDVVTSELVELPATVLHEPEADQ